MQSSAQPQHNTAATAAPGDAGSSSSAAMGSLCGTTQVDGGRITHRLHEGLLVFGQLPHVVALGLQILQHLEHGAKHVQIGSRAHIALVGREAEDGDGYALLCHLLLCQPAQWLDALKPAGCGCVF